MHPYRDMPYVSRAPTTEVVDDEPALYATVFAIGALRLAVTLIGRTAFDRETSVGLLMAIIGAFGLIQTWRRARGSARRR